MSSPLEILKKYWRFDNFKHPQEEIISSVLKGADTIALLPTGGGKSICFQIPTLIKDGVCIVISPLIALMNDQVKNLQDKNIKAVALTSKLSEGEIVNVFDNLQFGNYKFLYLSPEKLQSEFIQTKLKQINVQLIAVDEAHCISEWGHDFRPSYLNINIIRDFYPEIPVIALTASATEKVLDDIIKNLNLKIPKIVKKSFYRANLAYQIFDVEDKFYKVEKILTKIKGSKMIYTNTRSKTIEVSQQLNSLGIKINFYHGGMHHDDKIKAYEGWLSEKVPIIVATNAFGMGIDKSNVRAVIHLNLPQSIENYMQEAGRGGRDDKKAFSVVFKNKSDIYTAKTTVEKNLASVEIVKKIYFKLNQFFQISYGELSLKKHEFNIGEFCKIYQLPILTTYNALKILDRESILLLDENFNRKSTVKFITNNQDVFDYCDKNPSKNKLIKLILRTYGGVFESSKIINKNHLSNILGCSTSAIKEELAILHKDKIINFYNANRNTQIQFLVPREDDRTINIIAKNIKQRNQLKIEKIDNLISFLENDRVCRSKQLLSYFNEIKTPECGICDVCISKKNDNIKIDIKEASTKIINLLKEHKELSSKEIVSKLKIPEASVLFSLQILLEKNILSVTSQNKYKIN
ncbi:MAG: RecQ family ATP-dependent DNA helicase [Flavobacteriaceae bacterium]|nr:RecQ family ATP-dependent DNA helicase [Flavobacteriaceae bacterium]